MDTKSWQFIILLLAGLSIVWNIIEGGISIGFGIQNNQFDLAAYGGQSIVEVLSAIVVFRRVFLEVRQKTFDSAQLIEEERKGVRLIGTLYLILVALIVAGSIYRYAKGTGPDTTIPGLIISSVCIVIIAVFVVIKTKGGKILDSETVLEDASCSRYCCILASAVLVGSIIGVAQPQISQKCTTSFCNFWWLDPTISLIIAAVILKDGLQAIYNSFSPNFKGGGCCGGCKGKEPKEAVPLKEKDAVVIHLLNGAKKHDAGGEKSECCTGANSSACGSNNQKDTCGSTNQKNKADCGSKCCKENECEDSKAGEPKPEACDGCCSKPDVCKNDFVSNQCGSKTGCNEKGCGPKADVGKESGSTSCRTKSEIGCKEKGESNRCISTQEDECPKKSGSKQCVKPEDGCKESANKPEDGCKDDCCQEFLDD